MMNTLKYLSLSLLISSNLYSQTKEQSDNLIDIIINKFADYTFLWQILFIIFIAILFLIYRQILLKKANRILKENIASATTDIKEKNLYLLQQSKMASMGEMIGNIAHQWRQPLAQVNSSVLLIDAMLHKEGVNNSTINEKLLEIEFLTEYMSSTINDFQNFFHPDKIKTDFSIIDSIKKSISIAEGNLISNNIEVNILKHCDYNYYGYDNELQQVIVVILNNAKDAFESNDIDDKQISIDINEDKDNFIISITDNAGGIPTELIHKVFEPYFTTKYKSKGVGLGLYIAKMIIEDGLNGKINITNINNGAKFNIYLPKKGEINEIE